MTPTESMAEDLAFDHFGVIGAATKRGVEIDDAGRTPRCVEGRTGRSPLRRIAPAQSQFAARQHRRSRAHPVAPAAPHADPEQPLVPFA